MGRGIHIMSDYHFVHMLYHQALVQVIRVIMLHSAVDASQLTRHSRHACTQVFSTSGPTPTHTPVLLADKAHVMHIIDKSNYSYRLCT